ncbi:hypothetical protein [Flavobacterium sp.]|uniref:hypothetical protein n=1 Tax=Flavobacterium sp. TaxID=239 RepID=UPI0025BF48AF|nr:hypothetical protein [Flavobacterium sp.]MBA4153957.1 hypothetical protein [Flavobacterium sp.]
MSKYKLLLKNIKQSDLSAKDKKTLIKILSNRHANTDDDFDLDDFAKKVIAIYGISEAILKLFGLDIGS